MVLCRDSYDESIPDVKNCFSMGYVGSEEKQKRLPIKQGLDAGFGTRRDGLGISELPLL